MSPGCSRLVEALCLRLLERHPAPLPATADNPRQTSRQRLVVADYSRLRSRLFYSSAALDVPLQLFAINETTLMRW